MKAARLRAAFAESLLGHLPPAWFVINNLAAAFVQLSWVPSSLAALADLYDRRVVLQQLLGLAGTTEAYMQRIAIHLGNGATAKHLVVDRIALGERHLRCRLLLGLGLHRRACLLTRTRP